MKALKTIVFAALFCGLTQCAMAQSDASNPPSSASKQDEVKKLESMVSEQQKTMADQQKRLAELARQLEQLKQEVAAQPQAASVNAGDASPKFVYATMKTTDPARSASTSTADSGSASASPAPQEEKKESPLFFKIGGAEFTPGGFMDFTSIFRSTNTGNAGGTNFYAVPFSNAVPGHLTEERLTAANSRISLKAHAAFGENDVTAYYEADFLGNDAANVQISTNSHTFRQRLYWADFKRGKWEFLGGQTWSLLTPNRKGLSPLPDDIFYSRNEDFNYQVGLTWTRAPEFRAIYHPSDNWALGVAVENPQQFGGQGEITFPQAFNAQLAGQIDQGVTPGTPNLMPDIITKVAYDTELGGKHFHVETAGLITTAKITDLQPSPANFVTHTKAGFGGSGAINLELFKNFHFVGNAFWSDGGGRYIFGMAPQVVALPVNSPGTTCTTVGTAPFKQAVGCDVALSMVHSGAALAGFEWQVVPKFQVFSYYGGMYAQRNYSVDITSGATVQPFIGFGYPSTLTQGGSSNSNNRAIQEPTFGWIHTFWQHQQYGRLQFIGQYSYLTRAPWFVAAGAPKDAHLSMVWLDLRYVLP